MSEERGWERRLASAKELRDACRGTLVWAGARFAGNLPETFRHLQAAVSNYESAVIEETASPEEIGGKG